MRFLTRTGFILLALALAALAVFFFRPSALPLTHADITHNLTGWAWNGEDEDGDTLVDGGFGWISFNCTNDPATDCASVSNYGVHMDINTGVFSGYAWGGTDLGPPPAGIPAGIGWISFNPSPGCPQAPCEARANKTTGVVTGWARACSVFNSGCAGALRPNSRRGGWDGWISLNCLSTPGGCASSNYGITVEILAVPGGRVQGFAWGGNDTDGIGCPGPNPPCVDGGIGWIEFDIVFNDIFNNPPLAVPDSFFVNESIIAVSADLDVLANDFDPGGDPLTITAVSPLVPPASGTICIVSGGVCVPSGGTMLRFTPTPGFISPPEVTFTYTITDGRGTFASADVTVFVYDCGDGVRQLAESCDQNDFGPSTCQSERGPLGERFVGGQLVCTPVCTIDTSQCVIRPQFDFREF